MTNLIYTTQENILKIILDLSQLSYNYKYFYNILNFFQLPY